MEKEELAEEVKFTKKCANEHCNKLIKYKNEKILKTGIKNNTICASCRVSIRNRMVDCKYGAEHANWKSPNIIPASWFNKNLKREVNKRGSDITIELVYDLWLKQNKKCSLTGLDIGWKDKSYGFGHTASIDRIDSSIGYFKSNIQLAHKDVNLMKNKFSQEYFINICRMVHENNIS